MVKALTARARGVDVPSVLLIGMFMFVAMMATALAGAAGPFQPLIAIVTQFKTALLLVAVALISIGLIGAGFSYLSRAQEGITGVFYSFITILAIGALIFAADTIVATLSAGVAGFLV